ncbi:MAG: hypothetical protein Q4B18_06840, partial [Bacillota bacterium]|nr:hypothetical protein [Bacillota bacterium]
AVERVWSAVERGFLSQIFEKATTGLLAIRFPREKARVFKIMRCFSALFNAGRCFSAKSLDGSSARVAIFLKQKKKTIKRTVLLSFLIFLFKKPLGQFRQPELPAIQCDSHARTGSHGDLPLEHWTNRETRAKSHSQQSFNRDNPTTEQARNHETSDKSHSIVCLTVTRYSSFLLL